jgi:DNA-binding NtrC family response regulator
MCRAVGLCRGREILPAHLDFGSAARSAPAASENGSGADLQRLVRWAWNHTDEKLYPFLHDLLERELLRFALEELGGDKSQVAERLGMARGTVISRTKKYDL